MGQTSFPYLQKKKREREKKEEKKQKRSTMCDYTVTAAEVKDVLISVVTATIDVTKAHNSPFLPPASLSLFPSCIIIRLALSLSPSVIFLA